MHVAERLRTTNRSRYLIKSTVRFACHIGLVGYEPGRSSCDLCSGRCPRLGDKDVKRAVLDEGLSAVDMPEGLGVGRRRGSTSHPSGAILSPGFFGEAR
jgi:hypothetical protein